MNLISHFYRAVSRYELSNFYPKLLSARSQEVIWVACFKWPRPCVLETFPATETRTFWTLNGDSNLLLRQMIRTKGFCSDVQYFQNIREFISQIREFIFPFLLDLFILLITRIIAGFKISHYTYIIDRLKSQLIDLKNQ